VRRLVATLTVAAVLAAALPAGASTPALTDMSTHWAREQVEAGIASGYVSGYPDGTFRPGATITRAEFAKLLGAAIKLTPSHIATGFMEQSQPTPHWAFEQGHIGAAVSAGLVVPADYENAFLPDMRITRREIVIEAVRALGQESLAKAAQAPKLTAPDAPAYPDWLQHYAALATQSGIMTGYEDGSLWLDRTATRAEALVMVQRIVKKVSADVMAAEAPTGLRHPGENEPTWAWTGGDDGQPVHVTNGLSDEAYSLPAGTFAVDVMPAPGKAAWARYTLDGTGYVVRLAKGEVTELVAWSHQDAELLAVDDEGRLWFTDGLQGLYVANTDGDMTQVDDVRDDLRLGALDWNGTFWGVGDAHLWRVAADLDVMPYDTTEPIAELTQVLGMADDGSLWFLSGATDGAKAEAVRIQFGLITQRVPLMGPLAGGPNAVPHIERVGRTGPFVWTVVRMQDGGAERLEGLYRFNLNTGEFARSVLPGTLHWSGGAATDAAGGALLRDTFGQFWRLLP
jgi:hypothetical protein